MTVVHSPEPRPLRRDFAEQFPVRLAALQKIAGEHGGRCLASEYRGNRVKLEFECAAGHTFIRFPEQIFGGSWCTRCLYCPPEKLREIRELAAARGGACLSDEYRPGREKMRFRCAVGHEWEQNSTLIRAGTWCPRCRGRGTTIAELNELAAKHGGRCVSRRYVDSTSPLTWECAKGHRFRRLPRSILRGNWWCPTCRAVAGAVAKALAVAEERGGVLVSTRGLTANARLRWRCAKGHEWISKPVSVATGRRWCRKCNLLGIEQMQALAAERGGKCVSTEYVQVFKHLQWECEKGHRWWATPDSIKHRNSWCPDCGYERMRANRRSEAKDRR
jgi:hypothetical protein